LLAGIRLEPYREFRPGDLSTSGRNKGQRWKYGGISLSVSDANGDLEQEVRDAIAFLRHNFDSLRTIVSDESVDDARLDFAHYCRIGNNAFAQFDYLPPELLRLAGDLGIGIELSLYLVGSGA
jgi:hypothetical protein